MKQNNKGSLEDFTILEDKIAVLQTCGERGHNLCVADKNTGKILEDLYWKPSLTEKIFSAIAGIVYGAAVGYLVSFSAYKIFNNPNVFFATPAAIGLGAAIGPVIFKKSERKQFERVLKDYNLQYPTEE